jgi:hypothetical protein
MNFPQRLSAYIPLVFVGFFLSACSSVLSPLSVSEAQLEGHLREQARRFDREQMQSGSPLSVNLKDSDITIGPNGRDVVQLAIGGEVAVNAMMAKIPVGVFLKIEGTPVFVADEGAIYIKRLFLLDSRIESSFFKGDFKPVTDTLMRTVAQLLETMPIYKVSEESMTGTLVKMANLQIKVTPGKLLLVPGE